MRRLHLLTSRQVETLKKPGRHADGGNLYLSIQKSGSKRWVFFYVFGGRQREMMLGPAGAAGIGLAEARERAAAARAHLNAGRDPLAARAAEKAAQRPVPLFADYVIQFLERKEGSWRNPKSLAQWRMTLTRYCRPLARLHLDEIDTAAVLEALQPIWRERPETARRLRGRIERVLDAARVEGHRSGENPATWRGHLEALLSRHDPLERRHHAALPYADVQRFMGQLREQHSLSARALEFLILTAARTGEVLGADWSEFDLEKAIWTIPAQRMKGGREHRAPLSKPSLALLRVLWTPEAHGPVFCGQTGGRPLSNMAMLQLLRRMGRRDITVHGFRSAFRDWVAEETGFSSEVAEMALAHVIGNRVEAAYRRGDLFEQRRRLMEAWAQYCMGEGLGKIVPLPRAGGQHG